MMEGMTLVSFVVLPDPLLSTYPFTNAATYYFCQRKSPEPHGSSERSFALSGINV